jgi:hypothetical protein
MVFYLKHICYIIKNIIYIYIFIPYNNISYFNGYGHSLSHCLLILYADALVKCIN